jgi:hypothetical protein
MNTFRMLEEVRTPDGDGLVVGLPDLDQYEVRTERGLRIWKQNQIQSLRKPETVTKGDDPIPFMPKDETTPTPVFMSATERDALNPDKANKAVVTPEGKTLHGIAAKKYRDKQEKAQNP